MNFCLRIEDVGYAPRYFQKEDNVRLAGSKRRGKLGAEEFLLGRAPKVQPYNNQEKHAHFFKL